MKLTFGRHKGQYIKTVPFDYLKFLAGELEYESDAFRFVKTKFPEVVEYSKNSLLGICLHCGSKLVPIGHSRYGGKDHPDWTDRKYHKKCWKELQEDE